MWNITPVFRSGRRGYLPLMSDDEPLDASFQVLDMEDGTNLLVSSDLSGSVNVISFGGWTIYELENYKPPKMPLGF